MDDVKDRLRRATFQFPLTELLQERGITQLELSRRTGIKPTYLSRLARGHTLPGWRTILIIATALDLFLGDLDHD